MSQAARHLLQLKAQGIPLSRNKAFDFFKQPQNRAALILHRNLERIQKQLVEAAQEPDFEVRIIPHGKRFRLHFAHSHGPTRCDFFLSTEEIQLLKEDPKVAELLHEV